MTKDVTELMTEIGFAPSGDAPKLRSAYHSACSLQHGQKISQEPVALLAAAGFDVVAVPEGHICCGSAGTYNVLQPTFADELRSRKVANIESVAPDIVAAGNIGCIVQIGRVPPSQSSTQSNCSTGRAGGRSLQRHRKAGMISAGRNAMPLLDTLLAKRAEVLNAARSARRVQCPAFRIGRSKV